MKTRTWFYSLIIMVAVIAVLVWRFHSAREPQEAAILPATINRTCAPWDGAAFTVFIPLREGMSVDIFIWKSPDIAVPVSYSFPDETGRIGSVFLIQEGDLPVQLTGRVFFRRVEQMGPVEGWFDLVTDTGRRFEGKFKANWGDFTAICG